jgi:hypothetical protein
MFKWYLRNLLFKFSGVMMVYPFLTLQMRSLGLTFEDISIMYAFIPLFTLIASPVSGKIFAFVLIARLPF